MSTRQGDVPNGRTRRAGPNGGFSATGKWRRKTTDDTLSASRGAESGVQVIARAACILRALKRDQVPSARGLLVGEIAQRVSLPRSTAHRIISALQREGLVASCPSRRRYSLGPEIDSLARAAQITTGEIVAPYLRELAIITGETVELAKLEDRHLVVVDQLPGRRRLSALAAVGDVVPLTAAANGIACLAALDTPVALSLIQHEPNRAWLWKRIGLAQKTGLAIDDNNCSGGTSTISAAFADPRGAIFTISVLMPAQRFAASRNAATVAVKQVLQNVRMAVGV